MNEFFRFITIIIFCVMSYFCIDHNNTIALVAFLLFITIIIMQSQTLARYKFVIVAALSRFGCEKISIGHLGRIKCHIPEEIFVKSGYCDEHEMSLKIFDVTGLMVDVVVDHKFFKEESDNSKGENE